MGNRLWRLALHVVRWGLVTMLLVGLIAGVERLDGGISSTPWKHAVRTRRGSLRRLGQRRHL